MMRILIFLLILVHGLIHLMGFAKAFQLASLHQLTIPVSRLSGLVWLLTALLLILAAAYIRVDLRDLRYNSPYQSISRKGL